MWICSRCQTANKDGYTQCVQCSAPRNARRFGAGAPVSAPSVQTVAPERRMQREEELQEPLPSPRRQQPLPPARPLRPAGGLARLVGLLLAILLPLIVALVAVQQADAYRPAVADYILGEEKAPQARVVAMPQQPGEDFVVEQGEPLAPLAEQVGGAARAALSWALYALGVLSALLLAASPGLSLYMLGHIARGVRRR
ncbi:MAG: hypothetical protein GXY84_03160 [Clostridiales bacterium]|nr:hypothetical protein [Clostridiales bacterium]